jgi:hypothetical protein
MKRCVSFESTLTKQRQISENTPRGRTSLPRLEVHPYPRLESYVEFLRDHPFATKIQRIRAIQQFYDELLA